jgi:hypothetical protein
MNVAFEEARQIIHQAIDSALKLIPAYQVELLLSRYYDDIFKMAQKDYDTNLSAYKAAMLQEQEEKEKAMAENSVQTMESNTIENIEEQE